MRSCMPLLGITSAIGIGLLIFAGEFYTVERRWAEGSKLGATITKHPPLRDVLRVCVADDDPAALRAFQRTGRYRTSGWFLREKEWAAVAACMEEKGWLLTPVHIYTP